MIYVLGRNPKTHPLIPASTGSNLPENIVVLGVNPCVDLEDLKQVILSRKPGRRQGHGRRWLLPQQLKGETHETFIPTYLKRFASLLMLSSYY
jgi:hypothetical protein